MNALFGDATTAMPTPAQHAEVESLMARSPVPSLDIRSGGLGSFGPDHAIPGLDINPPNGEESGKGTEDGQADGQAHSEGIGGWITRMVQRKPSNVGTGKGGPKGGGNYRRLGDGEEDE